MAAAAAGGRRGPACDGDRVMPRGRAALSPPSAPAPGRWCEDCDGEGTTAAGVCRKCGACDRCEQCAGIGFMVGGALCGRCDGVGFPDPRTRMTVATVADPSAGQPAGEAGGGTSREAEPELCTVCDGVGFTQLSELCHACGGVSVVPRRRRAAPLETEPWPAHSLFFRRWHDESAYHLTHDVLVERGWKYQGDPCSENWATDMHNMCVGRRAAPRRCLWLVDESEAKQLLALKGGADRHRINTWVGTEAACFKTSFSASFRGMDFFPESYTLPDERFQMLARLRAPGAGSEYWVVKPKNDYGGGGIAVYANGEELQKIVRRRVQKRNVAQLYVARPYLVSGGGSCPGYKSHFRLYMCVTNMRPLQAYLYNNGRVMFATKPYVLSPETIGANFDKYAHLTNYSINAVPENRDLFLWDKPGIGRGTSWSMHRFLAHAHAVLGVTPPQVWTEACRIAYAFAEHLAGHTNVKTWRSSHADGRHHELYGLDIMMDNVGKLWLLEGNTDLGLGYAGDTFAGAANPDAKVNDVLTKQILHDLMALLGIDQYKEKGDASSWWCLGPSAAGDPPAARAPACGGGGAPPKCGVCGYPQDAAHPFCPASGRPHAPPAPPAPSPPTGHTPPAVPPRPAATPPPAKRGRKV